MKEFLDKDKVGIILFRNEKKIKYLKLKQISY